MNAADQSDASGRTSGIDDAVRVVAHELQHDVDQVRNASTTLAHLVSGSPDELLTTGCHRLVTAVDRLERSLEQLLRHPEHLNELRVEPVRMSAIVRRVVTLHDPTGRAITTRLSGVVALLDPVKVERIVDNLVGNALRHSPVGGRVTVTVTAPSDDVVRLTVRDEGPDAAHEEVAAGLAGDSSGSWSGLGVVARFVELHGGTATAEPGPSGTGLQVHVDFPQAPGREL